MQAVIVKTDGTQGIVYLFAYFLLRNAEVFGSECHILLNYGCNKLVVGVLKYHADAALLGENVSHWRMWNGGIITKLDENAERISIALTDKSGVTKKSISLPLA